ncbi:MAG: ABC transporter permease [Candidatus Heimdallarchaeota archaeon]|nr:MAG: ABC transporter permease [Candidatus Heimdallarchaeota archaeon]
MGRGSNFRGKPRLLFQIIRINLKKSLITLIGMTIALAVIAGSLIYLESTEVDYYLKVLEDPSYEKHLSYRIYDYKKENRSVEDITRIHSTLNGKIAKFNGSGIFIQSSYPFLCRMSRSTLLLNTSQSYRYIGLLLDESVIEDCINGSQNPKNQDEMLVFIPSDASTELTINQTIKLPIIYKHKRKELYYNLSLNISGVLTPTSLRPSSPLSNIVSLSQIQFIMNLNQYLSVLNTLRNLSSRTVSNTMEFNYQFNFSMLNHQNAHRIAHDLVNMRKACWDWRIYQDYTRYEISLPSSSGTLLYTLRGAVDDFDAFFSSFIIYCIPAFIVTFLFVQFSLGIINEGRRKALVMYKMRGISKRFIFTVLCGETFILALIASGLGVILGIPIHILISTTSDYLSFDLSKWPNLTIISQATIISVIEFSLCLTFLLNFRTILHLTKVNIVILEEEASKKKKRKRGTIRQNIDVFLLLQGIIGIFILNLFLRIITEVDQGDAGLLMAIIFPLALLSPFCLLIGFIFSFNRLMPIIFDKLGGILWKRDFKLFAMAVRNLFVNMKMTSRTTLLTAVTISFLMILSSLPISFNQQRINTAYYRAGSDLTIRTYSLNESVKGNLSAELNEVPGLTTTFISIKRFYLENKEPDIEVMAIEANFDEVAFWKGNYAKHPLSDLVHTLYSSKAQFPIILDSRSMKIENLTIHSNYIQNFDFTISFNFTIVETTDFWPGLIERHKDEQRFLIIKRSMFNNLINYSTSSTYIHSSTYLWGKVDPSTDANEVILQVKNITSKYELDIRYFALTANKLEIDPDSLEATFLWGVTNFNFLVSLLALLLLLFLSSIARMTNQLKEIGLSRALGMKFRQVFFLMVIEPLLLVLISGIPGGLIGLGLLMLFINLGQGPPLSSDPPFILTIDIPSILLIYGSILITAIIAGLITSYRVTRADVSKILKVE